MSKRKFSSYYFQLEETAKERYKAKLGRIGPNTDDPYTFTSGIRVTDAMPAIEYPDIYNYLISTPSPYTKVDLRAYIQEFGWIQVAGWLGDVSTHNVIGSEYLVVTAKVRHSKTINRSLGCCRKEWHHFMCTLYMYGRSRGSMFPHRCFIICH